MGHERVGYLPKTQKWRSIVQGIGNFQDGSSNIAELATQTTKNVRSRFKFIEEDKGVFAAFKFIVLFSHACKLNEPEEFLKSKGINLDKGFDIFKLTQSIEDYVFKKVQSKEYAVFATQAMMDAVSQWTLKNQTQPSLGFDTDESSIETWRKISSGAGFCELSRLFFSNFTTRYLKYFLEREASAKITKLSDRIRFNAELENHISEISRHSFETAKIVQSFSAGWYNQNVKDKVPADTKIRGFLSFGFQKINSELIREENRG